MMGRPFKALIVAVAVTVISFVASAGDVVSGSFSTTPSSGPGSTTINFTCQGTPTCTGTYTATHRGESCTNSVTFSGAIVLTGLNALQPMSSGNVMLSNIVSGSSGSGPICTYNAPSTNITGTYSMTSDGVQGSISVSFPDQDNPGGPPIVMQGSFGVGNLSNVRLSGTVSATDPDGVHFTRVSFACTGTPTCDGTFTVTERDGGCSNAFSFGGTFVMTGVDLSHPGSFQGTASTYTDSSSNINVDGTCAYTTQPTSGGNPAPYAAMWDGTNGTISIAAGVHDGGTITLGGTFTAAGIAPPPSFPMTVASNITPATANATAQVQPRPQDAGTTQSVFVFAHAPASILKDAPAKRAVPPIGAMTADDAVVCVLAQLNGQGQLVAVSASSLQAYFTGVLGAQAQAVTILSNVSTPNVAGATFFVGYGPNAGAMLTSGNYQSAIMIPGGVQCSSSLASAPAPSTPGALTGLWWNASESGWGVHFTQRGANVFAAWYTYDGSGNPKWYVSTCTGFTGASGTCNGALLQVVGPSFFGAGSFNPSLVNATTAGSLQLSFSNPNSAAMTYTVAGQTRSVSLTRQPLATGTTTPAVDYTDLWWGGTSESGWGMAMAQQYGVNFLAWYVYDATGKPTWLVATCIMSDSSCAGTLYRTTGPPFGPAFDSTMVRATPAGTVLVIFTDANNGILTYTVDGVQATKAVTRQLF